jgi:hypothetical protein
MEGERVSIHVFCHVFVMSFCLYAIVIYCSALQLMMALGSILFVLSMPDLLSPIELVCGFKSAGRTLCPQVRSPLLIPTYLPHMHAHGFLVSWFL